jgi:hypothetical protein
MIYGKIVGYLSISTVQGLDERGKWPFLFVADACVCNGRRKSSREKKCCERERDAEKKKRKRGSNL